MGFRSNFIAGKGGYGIPKWFEDKYPNWVFHNDYNHCFAQLFESKFYEKFEEDERFTDIQKMLLEQKDEWGGSIVVILLHECGGITRVKITKDSITAKEPTEWKDVKNVEHNHCYKCSD